MFVQRLCELFNATLKLNFKDTFWKPVFWFFLVLKFVSVIIKDYPKFSSYLSINVKFLNYVLIENILGGFSK